MGDHQPRDDQVGAGRRRLRTPGDPPGSHWRDDFPERDDADWAGHFDITLVEQIPDRGFVRSWPADAGDPA